MRCIRGVRLFACESRARMVKLDFRRDIPDSICLSSDEETAHGFTQNFHETNQHSVIWLLRPIPSCYHAGSKRMRRALHELKSNYYSNFECNWSTRAPTLSSHAWLAKRVYTSWGIFRKNETDNAMTLREFNGGSFRSNFIGLLSIDLSWRENTMDVGGFHHGEWWVGIWLRGYSCVSRMRGGSPIRARLPRGVECKPRM